MIEPKGTAKREILESIDNIRYATGVTDSAVGLPKAFLSLIDTNLNIIETYAREIVSAEREVAS